MAFLLGCEKVGIDFPSKTVFDEISLGIEAGERIGIVGRNGDGKSTLINVLAGIVEPDRGRVIHTNGLSVGVLAQNDALDDDSTVGFAIVGAMPEYEWASSARIRSIIAGIVGDIPWDAPVRTLSGGQRRRVDLARLLVGDYDVLMLDEPTNHLDVRAINWLAQHLNTRWRPGQGVLLVVTHDRWFLDEVCTSMWEVHDRRIEPFEGGFSAYIMQRVERERVARVAEERRQNKLRRELAWLSRGAQARSTKQKFRIKAAQELIADVPPLRNELELKRMAVARLGKQVVDVKNVSLRYLDGRVQAREDASATSQIAGDDEGWVLRDIEWLIGPGDRIGIVGENGAGKTTLLKVIQQKIRPTKGYVKVGKTVKFAMLSQHLDELTAAGDDRVRQVVGRFGHAVMLDGRDQTPKQLLERLGFTNADMNEPVSDLSGGQKRRLALMLILLEEPNVLILDEPGNDLDVDMLAAVEDLLDGWPGTLILVTHDRYLMERVTDNQYALINGQLRHLPGGIDEYLKIADELMSASAPRNGARVADKAGGVAGGVAGGGVGGVSMGAAGAGGAGTGAASAGMGAAGAGGVGVGAGLSEAGAAVAGAGGGAGVGVGSAANAGGEADVGVGDARFSSAAGGLQASGSSMSSSGAGPALSNAEQRALKKKLQSTERKMRTLESKIEDATARLHAADPTDYQVLGSIQQEIDDLGMQLEELELVWLEVAETLGV